ncbi:MAG: histidinol-phosphate transaminase [Balneolaceae bacterium]|nr:histidinol-phosphate transaminase [Balneolaceae bacterium]
MEEKRKRPVVPDHIRELKPYQAGKTIVEVKELYNPPRISKLASNENRLGCSKVVEQAVQEALAEIQDYPDPLARKLREKIADRNNVDPENVVDGAGSESLIANLFRTFFHEGEEAISASATFVGFFVHANVQNLRIKSTPLTEGYGFDPQALVEAITDRTKLIYIANPNNPTGTYLSKDEFEYLMAHVPGDVLVVMDEAYYEYAHTISDYPASLDYTLDNILTLRTFSKAYGLAGFRVGYGIGHPEVIEMMTKTKLAFEPSSMAQAVAIAAYDDQEHVEKSRQMVECGKRRLYSLFDKYDITYVPTAANSVMAVFPNGEIARQFNQQMMKNGVILRRLGMFGLANGIRITIGTEQELEHFEESFKEVYERLSVKKN